MIDFVKDNIFYFILWENQGDIFTSLPKQQDERQTNLSFLAKPHIKVNEYQILK